MVYTVIKVTNMSDIPSEKEIASHVLITTKIWSRKPMSQLTPKKQVGPDLHITGPTFRTFTGSLRMFIQRFKKETLTVSELSKAKTLAAVVILIVKKITGKTLDESSAGSLFESTKEN